MKDIEELRKLINDTDEQIRKLFEQRMTTVKQVAEYKQANGLPIFDSAREKQVIERNSEALENDDIRLYYESFLKELMKLSRDYQAKLISDTKNTTSSAAMNNAVSNGGIIKETLKMDLGERSYDITIGSGLISCANDFFNISGKALIVTDSGVPIEYARSVAKSLSNAKIIIFPQGEANKTLGTFSSICREMKNFGIQRKDAIIAVGGGVVGDICGWAAASYMRGIDFYNVPTTLLSQVDSSVGGKVAIDFYSVKNLLGSFYQPKAVLIDTDTLKTLDERQLSAGKAEIIKMAATSSKALFEKIESCSITEENLSEVICEALKIKIAVVKSDEHESHARKMLNFGHTLGHGIEAQGRYLHGECVGLGMLPMSGAGARDRIINALREAGLPTQVSNSTDISLAIDLMKHDKKGDGNLVDAVFVDEIGKGYIKRTDISEIAARANEYFSLKENKQ